MSRLQLSWQLKCIMALERLALPLWRWALARRVQQGKDTQISYEQKLMLHTPAARSTQHPRWIWGHAVGVGELLALLGLFRKLSEHFPEHQFLLTSTSRTSGVAIAQQNLGLRFQHQFAPIDHPDVMARFLDVWQPELACWSETDLWPSMIWTTRSRRIPMLMFNARLNENKNRRMREYAWFYQPLISCFHRIYAQNAHSHQCFVEFHSHAALANITGNIKALAPALQYDLDSYAKYQSLWHDRPVWLLASSHEGEEEVALQAHQLLRQTHPQALLVLVPRDAFRGAAIKELAQKHGFTAHLRSQPSDRDEAYDVYVADTMGELGLWYALSPVALIGGSLVPVGGHNPYEAIQAQCRVLSGPMTDNFSESYAALTPSGLAQTVSDANEINEAVRASWSLPRLTADAHMQAHQLLDDIVQTVKECLPA